MRTEQYYYQLCLRGRYVELILEMGTTSVLRFSKGSAELESLRTIALQLSCQNKTYSQKSCFDLYILMTSYVNFFKSS